MFDLRGLNGESIVVAGGWVEKRRGGSVLERQHASAYRDMLVEPFSRRRFVLLGPHEQLLQVVVGMDGFLGLTVSAAQHDEVRALRAALEAAREVVTEAVD